MRPPSIRRAWEILALPDSQHRFVLASGQPFDSIDPTSGEVVARVRTSTSADIDAAVEVARCAARSSRWASDGALRARVLIDGAASLRSEQHRLAVLLAREQGKTLYEASTEVSGAADMFEYYGGLARALHGTSSLHGPDVQSVVLREPMGVVAVITPWNWPLILTARTMGPAMAAGNACIVKPAELTSAIVIEMMNLVCGHPDLPEGVVTCVRGDGPSVGASLVGHDGIDLVSFTGGTATGVDVMKRAADGVRKVVLELGGKSPNIVFADADLDKALAVAAAGLFQTTGQICTAGSRVLVQRQVYEELVDRLVAVASSVRVGDPLEETTQMGPLVSEEQRTRVLEYVELGRAGGKVLAGGTRCSTPRTIGVSSSRRRSSPIFPLARVYCARRSSAPWVPSKRSTTTKRP